MEAQRNIHQNIGHREVFELSWPIMVSMLSYTAMSVVDTIFVGWLGTAQLAAVGIAAIAAHLTTSFGVGLMRGVKVNVAVATGAGRAPQGRRFAWQGLWIAVGLGVLVATLAPIGPALFAVLGANVDVSDHAAAYFSVRVIGAPLLFANIALASFFQGKGDTKTPMVASLLGNGLNIALDPLLIFGLGPLPGFGIAGAAWATVIAFGTGAAFLAARASRELQEAPARPDRELLAAVWRVGSPIGLSFVLEVAGFLVFASFLAHSGEAHLAAHVIGVRIISVSFLPGYALSEAASVLVGQSIGAGRREGAREAFRAALVQAVAIMAAWAVAFVAVPDLLIAVFAPEPEVAALARQLLIVAAVFQVADALATVALGALSGAGDTRFVAVISVLAAWAVNLPVAFLLAIVLGMGVVGAWLGLLAEIVFVAAVAAWRVRGNAWLEHPTQEELVGVPAPAK